MWIAQADQVGSNFEQLEPGHQQAFFAAGRWLESGVTIHSFGAVLRIRLTEAGGQKSACVKLPIRRRQTGRVDVGLIVEDPRFSHLQERYVGFQVQRSGRLS